MIRQFTCPVCKRTLPLDTAASSKFLPFCSDRCRRIDFFRWSEGKYAIVEPLDPGMLDRDPDADDSDSE